jgi:uncharacterized lipoprotein YmbA
MRRRTIAGFAALSLLAVSLAGCGSSPKPTYYTLSSSTPPTEQVQPTASFSVVVGPVTLPELVDRPELVVRAAANRVELVEQHRWAEPLKREVPRVIGANLSRLLGTTRVFAYQQSGPGDADYRVVIDFERFDSIPGDSVTVEARWSVRRVAGGSGLRTERSTVRVPTDGQGYDAVAAAHARALELISEKIAEAIRTMHGSSR